MRINTVTTPKEHVLAFALVLGFNASALVQNCGGKMEILSSLLKDFQCNANDDDKATPQRSPLLFGMLGLATSSMLYWLALTLNSVRHRYDYYFNVVRLFTLIHRSEQDLPDFVKLTGVQKDRLERYGRNDRALSLSTAEERPDRALLISAGQHPLVTRTNRAGHDVTTKQLFYKGACLSLDSTSKQVQVSEADQSSLVLVLTVLSALRTFWQWWYSTRLLLTRDCIRIIGIASFENIILIVILFIVSQLADMYATMTHNGDVTILASTFTNTYCASVLGVWIVWVLGRCAQTSAKFEAQLNQVRYAEFSVLTKVHQLLALHHSADQLDEIQAADLDRLQRTREMLRCVSVQLRDLDHSETIAGIPITWNVLKAAGGVLVSLATVVVKGAN